MDMGIRFGVLLMLGTGLIGCGPEPGADHEVVDEAIDPVLGLNGHCRRIKSVIGRYLDAYTEGDGNVVTRPYQDNNTQEWCFERFISAPVGYWIRHRTTTGQNLDAYTSSDGYQAVLRDFQNNNTQLWDAIPTGDDRYLFRQMATGRYLAQPAPFGSDYLVSTREDEATWFVGP